MTMPQFANLLSPVTINKMVLKNRIVMAPMGTSFFTEDGMVTERARAYYEARAKGGAGMITVENTSVDLYRGMQTWGRPAIDSDLAIPGFADIAASIKKHGAKAAIQLIHTGRIARSKLGGFQPIAPSPLPCPPGEAPGFGEMPHALTIAEIQEIIGLFAAAAGRVKKAGFDGIEIHGAHGYLIATFLSAFSNKRNDEYGGSLENRMRLLVQVIQAVRQVVGPDFALWCRINGIEGEAPGGITPVESQEIAARLSGLVDAISVSRFGYGKDTLLTAPDEPGAALPLAEGIKRHLKVPVIIAGRISPQIGEKAIENGMADIIAVGRNFLTDPDFPHKVADGNIPDIRPCMTCFYCQDIAKTKNQPVTCALNALTGKEYELAVVPTRTPKKVTIIGGGPAGMEAARVLSLRGHQPVLFEKDSRLGGQMNLAVIPPHKADRIGPVISWFEYQMKQLHIAVHLNTEVNVDLLRDMKPDYVILAAGSMPFMPPVPGIKGANVISATDLLAGRAEAGKNCVVIGGGATGCETAEYLYEDGSQVTVIEMLPDLALEMGSKDRFRLMTRIKELPITFITGAKCVGIEESGVRVVKGGKEQLIPADTIIVSIGNKPNNALYPVLREAGFTVRMAGDCWHAGQIAQAVHDGFRLGCAI